MKKHLVMICGFHFPQSSATSACAERYVSLFKDEYDIDIISHTEDGKSYDLTDQSGYRLHVLTNLRLRLEGVLSGTAKNVVHKVGSVLLYTSYLGNQRWFAKAVERKLNEIHSHHPIDVVFSVCSPISAHVGAARFCKRHPEIRSVAYTVDPYATIDRIRPLGKSLSDLFDYECKWLNNFNSVLLSEEMFDNRDGLTNQIKHCVPLPYLLPPFIDYSSVHRKTSDGKIHCVYAGSFYEDIRNPEFMLKVFLMLHKHNIVLHLYSQGCEHLVRQFAGCRNIIQHGLVRSSELQQIYADADALIGIGNSLKEFLPSKTIEYVATRKPIIYFNYPEIDNIVLVNYPSAIQIEMSENVNEVVARLYSFLSQLDGALVSEQQISQAYSKYSPANIKQILKTSFESIK